MRRDARQRRERLVRAATEIFEREGYHAPLERIAERAHVGRGTLYRNFPDRVSLTIAVIESHLDDLALLIARLEGRRDTFFVALRELASLALAHSGLAESLQAEGRDLQVIDRLRARVENLLVEPLARAKAAGLVRDDFALADVHLVTRMVAAGAQELPAASVAAGLARALELVIRGMTPPTPGPPGP